MISFEKPMFAPNGAAIEFHVLARAEIGPDADALTLHISSWPSRQSWLEGHDPVDFSAPRVEFAQLASCSGVMADVMAVLTGSGAFADAVVTVDQPTEQQTLDRAAHLVRLQRNALLAQSDWRVTAAVEAGQAVPAAWHAYRQALRDVPEQVGFPLTVEWPLSP